MRAEEFKVFELCGTRGIRFYFLETKVVDGAACSLEFSLVLSLPEPARRGLPLGSTKRLDNEDEFMGFAF